MLTMQAQLSSLQTSLADAERRVYESELIRRKLHNTIQVRQQAASWDMHGKINRLAARQTVALCQQLAMKRD